MTNQDTNAPDRTSSVTRSPGPPVTLSLARAWLALVVLSIRRQANARQMVWIALGLLVFAAAITAVQSAAGNWGMGHWRWPRQRQGPPPKDAKEAKDLGPLVRIPYSDWVEQTQALSGAVNPDPTAQGLQHAVLGSCRVILAKNVKTEDERTIAVSGFEVFSQQMIFSIYLTFLLPFCSLSFAVEAIGGERENRSLIWLLSRPLPRPLIYLAKFVSLLPWALGMNLGGFALLCVAAGPAGRPALAAYWPSVVWATLTFSSLFLLIGALFRWPAVVSIVYSFCLELVFGLMPGYLRYASINFYAKCLMFQEALAMGVESDKPEVYLSKTTALTVLVLTATALLALGMWLFSRKQYHEVD
jgi:ABC-2 type transport system permease protein